MPTVPQYNLPPQQPNPQRDMFLKWNMYKPIAGNIGKKKGK